jgi:predicted signal transduction protein with EAL and GGDEF domain
MREDLETLSAQLERYSRSYCVMMCDIDFFKLYNDTAGHWAGDEVLKQVAEMVSENLRRGDTRLSAPPSTIFENLLLHMHIMDDLPAKQVINHLKYSISLGWGSSKGTGIVHRYGAPFLRSAFQSTP